MAVGIEPRLFAFLVKHDAIDKFIINLKGVHSDSIIPPIRINSISRAFPWHSAPEGPTYWSRLSVTYGDLLRGETI